MITLQALVNVAVVTNSVPYTGVTLPLVSFGGSSTVISMVAIGLLLNISRQPVAPAPVADEVDAGPNLPAPAAGDAPPRRRVARVERRRHLPVQVAPLRARSLARRTRGLRGV
jgi:hypothetical protein